MRTASTQVIDIKPANRIKTVKKLENGDLQVTHNSGAVFTVSKDDPIFQAFAIYSILEDL